MRSFLYALLVIAIFFLAVHWLSGGQDEIVNPATNVVFEQ